ncbi:MAG: serine/threonine protein kinase [Acidobacteria bacterium]|nr:serine/threonine protein kinase [Acidobacteriota bacterium]
MDQALAAEWLHRFQGKAFRDLTIQSLVGNGKSAAVFRAVDPAGISYALKIFDKDIVEAHGRSVQEERIQREMKLKNLRHPNLIQVFDAGYEDDLQVFYIKMELIDGTELEKRIPTLARAKIKPLISQLAEAALFLEKNGFTHRDIKPSNIMITSDEKTLVLLDFGVIRPHDAGNVTDTQEPHFIGTLRYGSPEFLRRTEQQTIEGWRAITFYQLGGVLHDMIMRQPLFNNRSPYPRLVEAILYEEPSVIADDVSSDLIALTKNCLEKDPLVRLDIVKWDDFLLAPPNHDTERALKKISARLTSEGDNRVNAEILMRNRLNGAVEKIDSITRSQISKEEFLPPAIFETIKNSVTSNVLMLSFSGSPSIGFDGDLRIFLRVELLGIELNVIHVSVGSLLGVIDNQKVKILLGELTLTTIYKGHFEASLFKTAFMRSLINIWSLAISDERIMTAESKGWVDLVDLLNRSVS